MADSFLVKKPWVTEKSTVMNASGKYVFIVKKGASKPEVKKALKALYKVDAVSVNMVNIPAKRKRSGPVKTLVGGHRKAVVTLKEGQKIELN